MTDAPYVDATDVYIDFLCPFAWRGVELAAALRPQGERFRLRHYSLIQGNHPDNAGAEQAAGQPTWQLTEQPLDAVGEGYFRHTGASLRAFLAAHAAALQGEDAAWAFALALFRAVHEEKEALDDPDILRRAAETASLDLPRWETDRADEAARRAELRADLDEAAQIGVFGTPTFVLPDGHAAYYRFGALTRDPAQARTHWDLYVAVLHSGAQIGTIKRARHRPAPH